MMGSKLLLQRMCPLLLNSRVRQLVLPRTPQSRSLYSAQTNGCQNTVVTNIGRFEAVNSSISDGCYRSEHATVAEPDPITTQLLQAESESAIFDVLSKNKNSLGNPQVFTAIDSLWELQKVKADDTRELVSIVEHPVFDSLCTAIENNCHEFDHQSLVKVLYAILRLGVDPASRTVQQIVKEICQRINSPKFKFTELSRFAVCLQDMNLRKSPIAGQLVRRLQEDLDNIQNIREFSNVMYILMDLCSDSFQIKLVRKAMELLESDTPHSRDIRRILQASVYASISDSALLDRCATLLLDHIDGLDVVDVCIIQRCYTSLYYQHDELKTAIMRYLKDIVATVESPLTFSHVMDVLASPEVSTDLRTQLETIALEKMPDMSFTALRNVCSALRKMHYRSISILEPVCQYITKRIDEADLDDVASVGRNLINLQFIDGEMSELLGCKLVEELTVCINPHSVSFIVEVLADLKIQNRPDRLIVAKIKRTMDQLHVAELNTTSMAVKKMIQNDVDGYKIAYSELRLELNKKAINKLDEVRSMKLHNEIMLAVAEGGLDVSLLEEIMHHYDKLLHKVSMRSAPDCATFLTKTHCRHKPLLDTITEVVLERPEQLNYLSTFRILLPFAILNYHPPNAELFYKTCIEKYVECIDQYHPIYLMKIAHISSMLQLFPSSIINHIFGLDFLTKLDDILEEMPIYSSNICRLRLMELNRAVRLECPGTRVPWFHEEFCQTRLKRRSHSFIPGVLLDIQSRLSEVMGGAAFMRSWVITPYHYTIDFECVLDNDGTPLVCADYGSILNKAGNMSSQVLADIMQWGSEKKVLPPGAERVAIEYLSPKRFCTNSQHPTGLADMKRRHLEIMGYRYVSIPHFEWYSMKLLTSDDYRAYLKEKIFTRDEPLVYNMLPTLT